MHSSVTIPGLPVAAKVLAQRNMGGDIAYCLERGLYDRPVALMSVHKLLFGAFLILIGLLLLGRTTGLFFFSTGNLSRLLLPVLLVILGFWVIARKRQHERLDEARVRVEDVTSDRPRSDSAGAPTDIGTGVGRAAEAPTFSAPGKVKYSKVFGDIFVDCRDVDLQSIEVSTVFGDAEIKLHGGRLAKGLNRMVISGFVGNARILVPSDMPILARCSSFIGDVELLGRRSSGFGNSVEGQTPNYREAESKLYIATNSFIGDVRIYMV